MEGGGNGGSVGGGGMARRREGVLKYCVGYVAAAVQ